MSRLFALLGLGFLLAARSSGERSNGYAGYLTGRGSLRPRQAPSRTAKSQAPCRQQDMSAAPPAQ